MRLTASKATIISVAKRTVSITVKMSAEDYDLLAKAADHLWAKAMMSRSSVVLSLAKIAAESVLKRSSNK